MVRGRAKQGSPGHRELPRSPQSWPALTPQLRAAIDVVAFPEVYHLEERGFVQWLMHRSIDVDEEHLSPVVSPRGGLCFNDTDRRTLWMA